MAVTLTSQYWTPLWQGTKTFLHDYSNFVFGVEQSDVFSKSLQRAVKGVKDPNTKKYIEGTGKGYNDLYGSIKGAWKESKKVVENKSLWSVIKESFSSMGKEFSAAKRLAKISGKSGKMFGESRKFLSSTMKILGKRMPLIGNALMVAFAIPNICKAFTHGGVGTGVKETGKEAVKLGGFAAGAAIGSAICPFVGTLIGGLIGGIAGGMITEKIVGKSFTEKEDEAKAKAAEAQAQIAGQGQVQESGADGQSQQTGQGAQPTQQTLSPEQRVAILQRVLAKYNQGGMNAGAPNMTTSTNPFANGFNPYSDSDYYGEDVMAMNTFGRKKI